MNQAQNYLLSILRNKDTNRKTFRTTAYKLTQLLALKTLDHIKMKTVDIETTLAKTTGLAITQRIVLVPILRSGITMVEPFLDFFPDAFIGVVGLQRDEKTAQAHWYYENIPKLSKDDQIIIVDPMIATGGTGFETLTMLQKKNANLDTLLYISMVSAPEGINKIKNSFANITIITTSTDSHLNDKKFIIPGLGDFGDRYFGTE
ncbi:MAG: uracil phosphoribosyltransferase [Candidatus Dependentiae bacterium]